MESPFEGRVLEGLDFAAVVADEVVMVVAGSVDWFVAVDAGADVDLLEEALVREQVEDAVHRCDPDLAVGSPKLLLDLQRRHATVLLAEELDDGAPCSAL